KVSAAPSRPSGLFRTDTEFSGKPNDPVRTSTASTRRVSGDSGHNLEPVHSFRDCPVQPLRHPSRAWTSRILATARSSPWMLVTSGPGRLCSPEARAGRLPGDRGERRRGAQEEVAAGRLGEL